MTLLRPLCLIAVLLAALLSHAQAPLGMSPAAKPAATEQSFQVELITTWSFTNDGRGSRTEEVRVKVFDAAAAQKFGQLAFGYNFESERLSIDFVRVRKANGAVVETSVATAAEASLETSKEMPIFTDYRERNLSVVALSPGDTVEYRATVTILQPLAPGQFWLSHFFGKGADVRSETLIVEVPKDRLLELESSRPYESSEAGGRRTMRWSVTGEKGDSATKAAKEGELKPPVPDVQLSTFRDWREVARWYDGLQREPGALTPELRTKAAEITRGAVTDDERVRRIYDFVSRSIRYVSISFGVGRYQPHKASTVLHNGYGDCKDKHTLLAALLQGAGLTSRAVLIHSLVDLQPEVPAPSQFDHVITAVEIGGRRQWLDSTSGGAPFGYLFPTLRGKQALLVAPELADPLVLTTEERPKPENNSMDVDGRVTPSGDLEADMKMSLQGDLGVILRMGAQQVSQAEWNDFVQRLSYGLGFAGTVSKAALSNLESVELPLQIAYHYSRKDYFTPDPQDRTVGRKSLPLGLYRPGTAATYLRGKKLWLPSGQWVQTARLTFTDEHKPVVPIAISVSREYGSHQSKYEVKDNVGVQDQPPGPRAGRG